MAYVNMAHMPDPRTEYTVNFQELNGGINLSALESRLTNRESPEMRNLFWKDGVLCSRDGQEWVTNDSSHGVGYAMYDRLFHDCIIAHIGTKIWALDTRESSPEFFPLTDGVPEKRGTFFHYFDSLYYKTVGGYFCINYDADEDELSADDVDGYVPVTILNASPATGSGSLYQPENRIQAKKTIKYNAESGVTVYHLPVTDIDSVASVTVDGTALVEDEDYTVDSDAGTVTFMNAPPVTDPPTNNTVVITYAKANPDASNAVMDCPYAATYGGTGDLCVVMGGCEAQPNAFFWNGNNIAMDPTYFPISQYQFAGDTDDPITGFGKQQSFLVVFKHHSVGRAKMSTTELDGRTVVEMPYVSINDRIGCDLPWSIQLIDNNLVWCNTDQGVHLLKDSSYAYENNIECLSVKINDGLSGLSLLKDVRLADIVCSVDDNKRYWLCARDHVWVWDYENSDYKKPSWYYFTNIGAVAFSSELDDLWHLDALGRLTVFRRSFSDYGGPIDKSFRFAVQDFGGYDRLKNVNSVIFALRPDTGGEVKVTYLTDYETRADLTVLEHFAWRLSPRDLKRRNLQGAGFGAVFRRKPMCRRVRHFTMQLDNAIAGQDLGIVSAQIFYNYQGRFR
jgi:hypothetical protein